MSSRYGFLGPTGTFTEMALRQCSQAAESVDAESIPFASVDAALAALRAGDLDAAMVPIENSVEGGVSATLDALASGDPLVVDVSLAVDGEAVVTEPATVGPRLDPGQVDAAGGELLEQLEQASRVVLALEEDH